MTGFIVDNEHVWGRARRRGSCPGWIADGDRRRLEVHLENQLHRHDAR